jgi:Zn-dependent protease
MDNLIQTIAVYALPVIFAITLHEAAHGYVARYFGDMTAFVAGRVTLNPLKHIDPIGTIAVPLAILAVSKLAGGPALLFGWAKPVPVAFGNLRHPKRDMIWVAAAGPGTNLLQAILWAIFYSALHAMDVGEEFFYNVAVAGVQVNLVLMALNLLPIPPLDGGRIAVGLLPTRLALQWAKIEPYGMFILIALMLTNTLGFFLSPFLRFGSAIVSLFAS